jgi:hypothetical protein
MKNLDRSTLTKLCDDAGMAGDTKMVKDCERAIRGSHAAKLRVAKAVI